MRISTRLIILFVFSSCGNESQKGELQPEEKKDSVIAEVPADTTPLKLDIFSNIEQVEFCVPLPLEGYTKDEEQSDERAKSIFTNNKNPEFFFRVQGLHRSAPDLSVEEYFKNFTADREEQGEIITDKKLIKENNCFYNEGYWNNLPDRKFLEVTWVRNDDVVIFYAVFENSEEEKWMKIRNQLIQHTSLCEQ